MITNMNFYDICHEHLSYHSIESFENLLKPFNLKIISIETNDVNGGSIRFYVCKNACKIYDNKLNFGRGLIFHIAPSNVPTNFFYSLIFEYDQLKTKKTKK